MTAKAHPGICELCGHSATRAKMAPHLATCAPEHDAAGSADDLMRLQVEASGAPEYWLHSLRVNDQYRVCFVWTNEGPEGVEIVDYH